MAFLDSAKKLGKAVASVAVEFNDDEALPVAGNETSAVTVNPQVVLPVTTSVQTVISENDPAYIELAKAVLERDSPYTKFLRRFASLIKVKDMETRCQAALDVLSGEGISKEDILKSIGSHVGLLGAEKTNFESTLREHIDESVGALQKERTGIGNIVEENSREIAKLQATNLELLRKQAEIQGQIADAKKKIDIVAQSFNAAVAAIAKKLTDDKDKLIGLS